MARSRARSGRIAAARFQSGWERDYAFVSGRPGTKTGPEPKLASFFPVSTARNGTTPPTIRIGAGSLSPLSTTRARDDAAEATAGRREVTTGRRGETAGRREATATLRPPPSSSFSPVIPSLSPSSSSSLPPLGFSRVLGKGKKISCRPVRMLGGGALICVGSGAAGGGMESWVGRPDLSS